MSLIDDAMKIAEAPQKTTFRILSDVIKVLASEVRRLRVELENERQLQEAEIDDGK